MNFFQPAPNFYNANPLQQQQGGNTMDPFAGSNVFDPFGGSGMPGATTMPGGGGSGPGSASYDPFSATTSGGSTAGLQNANLGASGTPSTPNYDQYGRQSSQPRQGMTPITPVTSQQIKPNYGGLNDIYGKQTAAVEAALQAALFNQINFQTLGPSGMGIGPATAALNDPLSQRGSLPNPGVAQQAAMIDSGQLTGLNVGAGQASAGASYSGQPWYVPGLQAGQSLMDTATGAATSSRQMANDLAIAQENARLQAEAIQNDRLAQELARGKFDFGIEQYENMPGMLGSMLEQLGIGGSASGSSAIDTSSPFKAENATRRANQARSNAAQQSASAQRAIAEQMTGAGFGGSSPAIFANQLNAALQGAATGSSNAEKIYTDYEDKDANFRLAAQVAASEAQDRQARQILDWYQTQPSLLGQLMG